MAIRADYITLTKRVELTHTLRATSRKMCGLTLSRALRSGLNVCSMA